MSECAANRDGKSKGAYIGRGKGKGPSAGEDDLTARVGGNWPPKAGSADLTAVINELLGPHTGGLVNLERDRGNSRGAADEPLPEPLQYPRTAPCPPASTTPAQEESDQVWAAEALHGWGQGLDHWGKGYDHHGGGDAATGKDFSGTFGAHEEQSPPCTGGTSTPQLPLPKYVCSCCSQTLVGPDSLADSVTLGCEECGGAMNEIIYPS